MRTLLDRDAHFGDFPTQSLDKPGKAAYKSDQLSERGSLRVFLWYYRAGEHEDYRGRSICDRC